MSSSSSGSFSLSTTAAVVCLEKTETQPCATPQRRTTSATGAPNVAVDRPAVGTAGRLVLESLGSVELLLTDGKDEIETTVTARHSLVAEAHGESPFLCLWISESRRSDPLSLRPNFPGRDYSKRQLPFGDGQKVAPPDQPVILQPCHGVSLWSRTT